MRIDMPDYMRVSVTYYVVSASSGDDAAICISGAKSFDDGAFVTGLDAAINTLNSMMDTEDGRGMTAEEVRDYLRRQREEYRGDHADCDDDI